jgi:hypothetical protein
VEPFLALSRETWGEEILWDAVKDLPHGTCVWGHAGPLVPVGALRGADGALLMDAEGRWPLPIPFGQQRTRLMSLARTGDSVRVRSLLRVGAEVGAGDVDGSTALHWAAVGGRATLIGPIVGAFIVNGAKSWLTVAYPEFWLYFLGTLFIAVTLFLPNGVLGLIKKWRGSK